ncbi:helix-turn-helix transcriptional regulator [Streptomyces sp. PA03-1a]|nr:helix-turn-helix transcriptional regulator [Streptomyces sp. PA03-1a]MDX2813335.1 helix-turn-helix transcriptional regulator [Streptomyces sp. PA03-5A]
MPELVLRTAFLREKAGEVGDNCDAHIAKRIGVRQSTVTRLLTGQTFPSVHTLWALGAAYEVPVSDLIAELPA